MNLRHLEVFRAIMETGSTQAAAQHLLISQPGVSNILRQFERLLGLQLFERMGGRLRPTQEARILFEQSEKVFSAFSSFQELAGDLTKAMAGTLRMVVSPSLAHSIIPPAIAAFHKDRPQLRIHLDTQSNEQIIEKLASGSADFALTVTPVEHPLVSTEVLREGALFCAMPPAHPLAVKATISPADLLSTTLISYPRASDIGRMMNAVFRDSGEYHSASIQVRYIIAALDLVKAGAGVAIIDEFTNAHHRHDLVVTRPLQTSRTLPLVLSFPRHEPRSSLAQQFIGTFLNSVLEGA